VNEHILTPEIVERELRREAERMVELRKHPGFTLLLEKIASKEERMDDALVKRIKEGWLDLDLAQRQVDYNRGFVAGMKYPDEVIKGAEEKLRKYDLGVAEEEERDQEDFW
jgi:hypothetical protein